MHRHLCQPRPDWRQRVESVGLSYHSHENAPYWDESACYEFSADEVDRLERAAGTLHCLCIDAAEQVIARGWWDRLGIPEIAIPAILRSWERDDFSLYGRFDLAFDGSGEPKMLEYNADTPTALVEAAVVQWFWLQDLHPEQDQFNSIHERLIEAWRRRGLSNGGFIHFSALRDHPEDQQTILYLRDTCEQAGLPTVSVAIEDLGWLAAERRFSDLEGRPVTDCFKLYPWEWMWREAFAKELESDPVRWLEPAWKLLLQSKGLLPVLWELFPGHPNLLPAYDSPEPLGGDFVRKPRFSREGANVSWFEQGRTIEEHDGIYSDQGYVYQALARPPSFDGNHPVFGAWIVDHEPAGLGIREDTRLVTGNLSRFVPHFLRRP
jgi:glutathionylspermidine synthase